MDNNKRDFWMGFTFFCGLVFCIFLRYTTPDGMSFQDRLLTFIGISPTISFDAGTFYLFNIIWLVAVFLLIRAVMLHWHMYGVRFRSYPVLLRFFPIAAAALLFLLSNAAINPSLVDRIYFWSVGQKSGLQAVTFYPNSNLRYTYDTDSITYQYDIFLSNHSSEWLEFNIKISHPSIETFVHTSRQFDPEVFDENVITNPDGSARTFTLAPNQSMTFTDEFAVSHQMDHTVGSGNGSGSWGYFYNLILTNETQRHTPPPLERRPLTIWTTNRPYIQYSN